MLGTFRLMCKYFFFRQKSKICIEYQEKIYWVRFDQKVGYVLVDWVRFDQKKWVRFDQNWVRFGWVRFGMGTF